MSLIGRTVCRKGVPAKYCKNGYKCNICKELEKNEEYYTNPVWRNCEECKKCIECMLNSHKQNLPNPTNRKEPEEPEDPRITTLL